VPRPAATRRRRPRARAAELVAIDFLQVGARDVSAGDRILEGVAEVGAGSRIGIAHGKEHRYPGRAVRRSEFLEGRRAGRPGQARNPAAACGQGGGNEEGDRQVD
jgi:hypothetical protein